MVGKWGHRNQVPVLFTPSNCTLPWGACPIPALSGEVWLLEGGAPHVWAGQGARLGRRRKESGLRCSHRSLDPAGLSRVPPGLTSLFQTRLLRGLQGLRTSGPLSDPLAPELLTQQSFSMQAA